MARAYRYAEGSGPYPRELQARDLIEKFGAWAVYGRPLWAHELRRITAAEAIVNGFRARAQASDFVRWTQDNPALSQLVNEAMRAANG